MLIECDDRGFSKPMSSHSVSTAYCAYSNVVIKYNSAKDNTKTGYLKTEQENIKISLMKHSLKKSQAIVKKKSIVKGKYIIYRHPFKSLSLVVQWGGFQGRTPPFFGNFFFSGTLFKLSGSKPFKKNKTKQNEKH